MSAELDALADAIDTEATKAASTSADGVSVNRRPLKELQDFYDWKAGQEAANNGRLGVGFFATKPPGAV